MTREPRSPAARLGIAAIEVVFCVALPLTALSWAFHNAVTGGAVTDFEKAFYPAAEMLRGGSSPYPGLDDPEVAAGVAYVYPPLTAILGTPLTALSAGAAGVVVMALLVAAVVGTLFILGIRDWRCYGIVFAWPGVYAAIMTGTLSIPLALTAALVWRFRDRARLAGASLGLSAALKPILWPIGIWLVATRRLATAMLSLAVAVVALGVSWAVIGFADVFEYPGLLHRVQELEEDDGYTVYALAIDLGASSAVARGLGLVVAVALLAGVVHLGRRGDDRRAFVLAIAATLACSPIVWLHYFALLLVPVAVVQPRLGLIWFVPLGMWGFGAGTGNGTTAEAAVVLAVVAATFVLAVRAAPPGSRQYRRSLHDSAATASLAGGRPR